MPGLRLLRPVEVDLAAGRVFRVSMSAVAIISVCTGVLLVACIAIGARNGILLGSVGMAPALLAWWIVFWLVCSFSSMRTIGARDGRRARGLQWLLKTVCI